MANVIEELGRIRLQRSRNALSILAMETNRQRSVVYGGTVVCDFDPNDELTALTLLGSFSISPLGRESEQSGAAAPGLA
jgi:hypothetical protein